MLEGAAVGSHFIQSFPLYHDLKWRVVMDIHFSDIKSSMTQGVPQNDSKILSKLTNCLY